MGLKCSFLGHAYEEAGVEREREEQGSEVVTVVKELEQCSRCGRERVVSESTEVTTVVDPADVEADVETGGADAAEGSTGGFGGAVERAMEEGGTGGDGAETLDEGAAPGGSDPTAGAGTAGGPSEGPDDSFEPRDPEEEDAEILTDDDDDGRSPGEWPDDPVDEDEDDDVGEPDIADTESTVDVESDHAVVESGDGEFDDVGSGSAPVESDSSDAGEAPAADRPDEESLSGITVPEGRIVCPECTFEEDAESSYREGDPCPRCNAWLTTVEE